MQLGKLKLKLCRYGWMLYTGPYIGKCLDLYGQYSEAEIAVIRSLVPAGGTIIDVGANIGALTIPMSRIVGEAGRVYAIESHSETFNVLCANLALNAITNTRPINAFVATSENVDTASPVWGKFAYVSRTWATQFVALDALDLAACDLIKVDVDGKELEVLRSGEMQIERFRPFLYFENDVRDASRELLGFAMDKLGYDLYWHPAPIFDADNYFGNPVDHWAPNGVISLMVLGVPAERKATISGLRRIASADEWWMD
jgi:FkbM family methyltransferase